MDGLGVGLHSRYRRPLWAWCGIGWKRRGQIGPISPGVRPIPGKPLARAFSIIELVIVVVIMGIISAIAIPKLSGASERASYAALAGTLQRYQKAIDLYAAEHEGNCPATETDGSITTNGRRLVTRLISKTDISGTPDASGIFGAYLQLPPVNPLNNLVTVRIDGAAAGQGTHGWRYDSVNKIIESDTSTITR